MSQDEAKTVENAARKLEQGTPRIAVEKLLDDHRVEHSWASNTKCVYAILRNVDTGRKSIVTKNISFVFQFDSQEKLLQTTIEILYTGP